jgi:ABC-2 type transport system ATP-binding protein
VTSGGLRQRVRSRRVLTAAVVAVLVAAAVTVAALVAAAPGVHTRSQFVAGTPESGSPVRLDTTLYLPEKTPAPAVLLAHGFGGTKADLDSQARTFAQHGYVVLAYTARGFGNSGGLIHLDAIDYEVHDASLLVSYLAAQPQVAKVDGRPRVAVAGSSYGGALALLLAGTDSRIGAVAADITWNDLEHALFPNAASAAPNGTAPDRAAPNGTAPNGTAPNGTASADGPDRGGVFKKLWAGYLFQNGHGGPLADPACGRFAPDLCAAYQRAARTGTPDAGLRALLRDSSPATVLDRITAPTLLSQGEQDSLFPLTEADANARGIAAHGTPVRVIWRSGGHDASASAQDDVTDAVLNWFDAAFAGRIRGTQPFQLSEQGAAISSENGRAATQTLEVAAYPGIGGALAAMTSVRVFGPDQQIAAPAGGNPAAITDVPVLGGVLGLAGQAAGVGSLGIVPGQIAAFRSEPLRGGLLVAGPSSVTLTVTASTTTDATLFLALRDLAPDGSQTLPANLVAPLLLTGLTPGRPQTVTVRLPAVVHQFPSGHRLALTVATTDLAYQLPLDARTYTVALAAGSAPVSVPTTTGRVVRSGHPLAWLIVGLIACAVALLAAASLIRNRRRRVHADPTLADVPIAVTDLVKEYGDGYRAVDGVSFRVERGQVVGLLGPNGAGKTTTLRVLVGLIRPTSGTIHVFGEPITAGAAVLARVGAFIEGPGFLPHLSGHENLRLYWAATGRPEADAELGTALEIAGLGDSLRRRVKTYSHGMKQRLGIAQAMLGLPEVLVLDEPTNGLDPPQIAEMREVLQRYAATGRTVVVSSHLLAEVEQTCTHVVVMHKGRLVAAGTVAEVAGAGGVQLAVDDPQRATDLLTGAGLAVRAVPARRALEDVFLDLVGGDRP